MLAATAILLLKIVVTQDSPPEWDLNSRFGYNGLFDPRINEDIGAFEKNSKAFFVKYNKDTLQLPDMLQDLEKLTEERMKLSAYPELVVTTNRDNSTIRQKAQTLSSRMSDISARYFTFVEPLLGSLDIEDSEDVQKWKPYIKLSKKLSQHRLSPDIEIALQVRDPWYGPSVITEALLSHATALNLTLQHPRTNETLHMNRATAERRSVSDPDPLLRRAIYKKFNEAQGQVLSTLATVALNVVSGLTVVETKERRYDQDYRGEQMTLNEVEPIVIHNMLKVCRTRGSEYAKRYNRLKKKVLMQTSGLETYTWADRLAPVLVGDHSEETKFTWKEAVDVVSSAYRQFSPKLADQFIQQVKENRYDARQGHFKATSDFCMPVGSEIGSFVTTGFAGFLGDVTTLAHETGHVLCHKYSTEAHGILQSLAPRAISEIVPLFAEEMTFFHVLGQEQDDAKRLHFVMAELDNVLNTVVRQAAFDRFEWLVCEERENGSLSTEQICELWIKAFKEFYGDSVDDYDDLKYSWISINHIFESPFYVHSYVFAQLVAAALAKVHKESPDDFEDKFIDMLSSGMTKNFTELMTPFGLDGTSNQFWREAIEFQFEDLLSQAEKLVERLFP